MINITALREELATVEQAQKNAKAILDALESHQLEASGLYIDASGVHITWENGHTPTRMVRIQCQFNGLVHGCATDDYECVKRWDISGLTCTSWCGLTLSLDETIEYIRTFIWANHND